jgi:lipopolysaccharide export system protein LptC
MISKRLAAYGITLIAVAAGMNRWIQQPTSAPSLVANTAIARADYFLEDFSITQTNEAGQATYRLRGTSMIHYPTDTHATFLQPALDLFQHGQARWRVTAYEGKAATDGSQIELIGNVLGVEQTTATQGARVRTTAMTLKTRERIAETRHPVYVENQGLALEGVGLKAHLDNGRIHLLHEVHANYAPTK